MQLGKNCPLCEKENPEKVERGFMIAQNFDEPVCYAHAKQIQIDEAIKGMKKRMQFLDETGRLDEVK